MHVARALLGYVNHAGGEMKISGNFFHHFSAQQGDIHQDIAVIRYLVAEFGAGHR